MEILEDYTTTIDLSGNRNKQFVFAGQLYGTFFAIFATFNLDKTTSTNTSKVINTISLEILNYKGLVNIGIVNAQLVTDATTYASEIPNSTTISINLQALCSTTTTTVNGVNGLTFTKGSWLIFDRELTRIDRNKHPNVWDEEFDYRDGLFEEYNIKRYDDEARTFYREQSLLPQHNTEIVKPEGIMVKDGNVDLSKSIEKDENLSQINSLEGVTRICVVGQSKILF